MTIIFYRCPLCNSSDIYFVGYWDSVDFGGEDNDPEYKCNGCGDHFHECDLVEVVDHTLDEITPFNDPDEGIC